MSYTALYITASTDITDSVARDFVAGSDYRLDTWMENTDKEIQSIAQEHDIAISQIEIPVHYKIKEYAIAYYCYLLFQDCFGENDVEIATNEVHQAKLKYYLEKCNFLRPTLTKEMFSTESASLNASDRVSGGLIWM